MGLSQSRWWRFPWEGISDCPYFWTADSRYVNTGSGLWIGQKGGQAFAVSGAGGTAATFPTYHASGGGPVSRGYFQFNGTTDMISVTGGAGAVPSGFQNCTVVLAGTLDGTPATNERILSFTNTSDTTDQIGIQTLGNQGSIVHPLGVTIVAHSGVVTGTAYYQVSTTNGGLFVASLSLERNTGTNKYVVSSATYGGSPTGMVPSGATDFTTNTLTTTRLNLGGIWAATKFFSACKVRAVGVMPHDETVSGSTPSGAQQSICNYMASRWA